ncbi:hypothetical protein ACFXTH_001631 [Malus domestica]
MHRRAQHEGAVGLPCLDVLQCGTFAVLSGVCELLLQPKQVGQGHGEKSTLEMVRCTNMEKARQGKAGILLWMRRPITSESGLGSGSVYI